MYSSENEFVDFLTVVDTNKAKGNVDEWLISVEEEMLIAVKHVTEKAFN